MKKWWIGCFTVIVVLCVKMDAYAQYGYGITIPSKAAVLHLNSENKGLLIPRVSLTDSNTFLQNTSLGNDVFNANSLLVYNLSSNNGLSPGFYYWTTDGTVGKWHRLITASETIEPWQIQGTLDKATDNTQDIYQTGSVVIGKDTTNTGVFLDVAGAFRSGELSAGAVGPHSIASGYLTTASGEYSVAFGHSTIATDWYSFAAGRQTEAYGTGSTSFGYKSKAHGNYSFSAGREVVAGTLHEAVLGGFNVIRDEYRQRWNETDPILQIGIGTGPVAADRKNALTILKNGKVGIGNFATNNNVKPKEMLHIGTGETLNHRVQIEDLPNTLGTVSDSIVVVDNDGILKSIKASSLKSNGPWYKQGSNQTTTDNNENIYQQGAVAIGKNNGIDNVVLDVFGPVRIGTANASESIGQYSFAGGQNVIASGNNAVAFGSGAKALGNNSLAVGRQVETESTSIGSVALGWNTKTSGNYAFASGTRTKAEGLNAVAFGEDTKSHSRSEFVIGRFNAVEGGSMTGWTPNNTVFQIGIGTGDDSRKNAITVRKNGWVGIGTIVRNGNELLTVDGSIQTASTNYPDYVFETYYTGNSFINPSYRFQSLPELKDFIKTNGHLPDIPKATELSRTEKGDYVFDITDLAIKSLEKIEELYLHIIEQEEKIQLQKKELALQKKEVELIKQRLKNLENALIIKR